MTNPQELARPLSVPKDLDPLLERIGDARVVCIGEASHGTHEFYTWRAALTKRLIEERDFDLVAVEGDWPDCIEVNHCVTWASDGADDPREVLQGFERWPTWMWANQEVLEFTEWLRETNRTRSHERRVGFYGLDVYSLWESLRAVVDYLAEHHPAQLTTAAHAFSCFDPYAEDPQAYARATRLVPQDCEAEVVALLGELLERHGASSGAETDRSSRGAAFEAEQNARAAVGAEAYYRALVRGGPDSWNVRDRHMADTLDRLLRHHDSADRPARAVVWEHNTHIGDARFTDMSDAGMVNVGQLVRERYGETDCVLIGFGTHSGRVIAAPEWGLPPRPIDVPFAREHSVEDLLHREVAADAALFVFSEQPESAHREDRHDGSDWLGRPLDHRAIGVVYRPERERWGNYVPTVLGRRYDAFLWFNETTPLQPLRKARAAAKDPAPSEELETWPFGA